jgi:hypothetical protein
MIYMAGGIKATPDLLVITQKGRAFIDDLANRDVGY